MDRKDKFEILNDSIYGINFNKNKFHTPENLEFELNKENYTVIFDAAIEEDDNGFVIHNVSIAKDDLLVGYLRMFYLPEENLEKYYKDIFHYMEITGNRIGVSGSERKRAVDDKYKEYTEKTLTEKQKTIENIALSILPYNKYLEILDKMKNIDNPEIKEKYFDDMYYNKLKKIAVDKYGKDFESYKNKYLNKVKIEFVKVRGNRYSERKGGMNLKHEKTLNNLNNYCKENNISIDFLCRKSSELYFNKGLGKRLYKFAADWMALNGLNLYRTATNDLSEKLWDLSFDENPDVFNKQKDIDGKELLNHSLFNLDYLKSKKDLNKKQRLKK